MTLTDQDIADLRSARDTLDRILQKHDHPGDPAPVQPPPAPPPPPLPAGERTARLEYLERGGLWLTEDGEQIHVIAREDDIVAYRYANRADVFNERLERFIYEFVPAGPCGDLPGDRWKDYVTCNVPLDSLAEVERLILMRIVDALLRKHEPHVALTLADEGGRLTRVYLDATTRTSVLFVLDRTCTTGRSNHTDLLRHTLREALHRARKL